MRKMLSLLVILLVVGLSYVVYGASPESYMPLKEGMVWEFQHKVIDLKTKKQVDEAKSIKKNLPPMDIKGTKVTPQLFSFYKPKNVLQNEIKYFIRKEPSGFSVFARQSKSLLFEDTMPNIKSAKKRMELSRAASSRNRVNRSRIRTAIRRLREAETAEAAQVYMKEAISLLDRAATKRLMHPNRVARIKSQIVRHVNEMSA